MRQGLEPYHGSEEVLPVVGTVVGTRRRYQWRKPAQNSTLYMYEDYKEMMGGISGEQSDKPVPLVRDVFLRDLGYVTLQPVLRAYKDITRDGVTLTGGPIKVNCIGGRARRNLGICTEMSRQTFCSTR